MKNPMQLLHAIQTSFWDKALETGLSFNENDIQIQIPDESSEILISSILSLTTEISDIAGKNCLMHFEATVSVQNSDELVRIHAICPALI